MLFLEILFFFHLKGRTSERSLTTLEMGKNCKLKLEHRTPQSPYLLPIVRLCHAYTTNTTLTQELQGLKYSKESHKPKEQYEQDAYLN